MTTPEVVTRGKKLERSVRPEGFEPPTFRSVAGRSNPLSYGRLQSKKTNALRPGVGPVHSARYEGSRCIPDAEARGFEPRKGS
jgi:hypothetical protein